MTVITVDEIRLEADPFTGFQRSAIRRARREAMAKMLAAPNNEAKDTAYRLWKAERVKLSQKYGVATETIDFIATGHLPADKEALPPEGTWTPQPNNRKKQKSRKRVPLSPLKPTAPAVDVNVWPLPPTPALIFPEKQPAKPRTQTKPKKTLRRCPVCCKMAPASRSKFLPHKVKGGANCPGTGTSTKHALVVRVRVVGGGLPGLGNR